MRTIKVSPSHFERHNGITNLVSRVEWRTKRGFTMTRWHYSARDVTVEQLCDECARKFKADRVEFQAPLLHLPTAEFHAADYL